MLLFLSSAISGIVMSCLLLQQVPLYVLPCFWNSYSAFSRKCQQQKTRRGSSASPGKTLMRCSKFSFHLSFFMCLVLPFNCLTILYAENVKDLINNVVLTELFIYTTMNSSHPVFVIFNVEIHVIYGSSVAFIYL